jgi:hypothetical protein
MLLTLLAGAFVLFAGWSLFVGIFMNAAMHEPAAGAWNDIASSPLIANARDDRGLFKAVVCRDDLYRGAVTNELQAVDAATTTDGKAAELKTGAWLRLYLECFPTDGNLWFRLGLLSLRNGARSAASRYFQLSACAAPAEGWVISNRLRVAAAEPNAMPAGVILNDLEALSTWNIARQGNGAVAMAAPAECGLL